MSSRQEEKERRRQERLEREQAEAKRAARRKRMQLAFGGLLVVAAIAGIVVAVLVTTGGGGDGEALIEWVLRAYEHDPLLPYPALLVLGPFMQPERQAEFMDRAARLKRVDAITFHSHLEALVARAAGVVAMGGYNTFCEVLSFDKPALLVPRIAPREEQLLRVQRGAELGLIDMLHPDEADDPAVMVEALRRLPNRPRPSDIGCAHMMNGLDTIGDRTFELISRRHEPMLSVIEGGI